MMRANHAYRNHFLRKREAAFIKCDVTKWDEQVALFELAIERFGSIDIVVSVALLVPPVRVSSVLRLKDVFVFRTGPKCRHRRKRTSLLGQHEVGRWQACEAKATDVGGEFDRRYLQ